MALEIVGRIIKLLPEQSGSGKNGAWKKQEFIVETVGEQFPKKVCISAWGDKADLLQNFNVGEEIKVSFNVESREYNERWYTDVRAWRIEKNGQSAPQKNTSPRNSSNNNSDGPEISTFHSESDEDDLPF